MRDLVSTQEQCQLYREKDGHIWTPVFYSVNIADRAGWIFYYFVSIYVSNIDQVSRQWNTSLVKVEQQHRTLSTVKKQ